MYKSRVVFSLAAVAMGAAPASASVFFTFDDPGTELEVRYEQPGPGDGFGTMTYGAGMAPPIIDFVVDATEEGGGITEFSANLIWSNWQVSTVSVSGPVTSATVSGDFDFVEAGSGDSILSGTFTMGLLIEAIGAGNVITSTDGGLSYTVGPALAAVEPQILGLQAPQDGVYTLTNITFDDQMIVNVDNEDYFGDFSANAAFTGTAEAIIPTPGSTALALLGVAGMIHRRKR